MYFLHKTIKKFAIDGTIADDASIIRLKEQYIVMLTQQMRDLGYVRRADIDPDFSIFYVDKAYEFKLTVYGIYVGRLKAQCIDYVDKNRPIPITQQNKSDESLMESDLT